MFHRLKALAENRAELLKLRVVEGRQQLARDLHCCVGVGVFTALAGLAFGGAVVASLWAISPVAALFIAGCIYSAVGILLYRRLGSHRTQAGAVAGRPEARGDGDAFRLKAEIAEVTAEPRNLAAPGSTLATLVTSTASLVEGIAAIRRVTRSRSLPVVINGAVLASGIWLALRATKSRRDWRSPK